MPYDTVTKSAHKKYVEEWEAGGKIGPKPTDYRGQGKVLQLALSYGLGEGSLAESLEMDLDEAKELMTSFKENLRSVFDYEKKVQEFARKHGYVETMLGRRRRFPNYALPELTITMPDGSKPSPFLTKDIYDQFKYVWKFTERKALVSLLSSKHGVTIVDNKELRQEDSTQILNSVIQGSAGDMTKLAMFYLRTNPKFIEIGAIIALAVHDEIIIDCPKEHEAEGIRLLEEAMLQSAYFLVKTVPFVAEAEVMERWVKGD